MPHQHYSVDSAVFSHHGELFNSGELFIPDITKVHNGYPYLRTAGYNSDVIVYDAKTGKRIRREAPNGTILETF